MALGLSRKEQATTPAANSEPVATAQAVTVAEGAGRPLPGVLQRQAGNWFGTNLAEVRIHDDAAARDAAESIGARAYTVGHHIVFGAGGLAGGGDRLLAHELAHVVQNRSSAQPLVASGLSQPADPAERAADAAADRIGAGLAAPSPGPVGARAPVARAPADSAGEAPVAEAVESAPADFAFPDEVLDGDSAIGGPILSVPSSPDGLDAEDAGDDHRLSQVGQAASQAVPDRPAMLGLVQLQRRQPQAPPPTNRNPLPVPTSARRWITRIDISLAVPQTITVHWSDRSPDQNAPVSSGKGRPCTSTPPCPTGNELNCTPVGTFHPTFRGDANYVNDKGDHMSYYVDLGVGNRGIGIHNSQLVTGSPASHGCVRVPEWMARLINGNVIRATDVVITGTAPARAYRDRSCPAPPTPRGASHGGAAVHRSAVEGDGGGNRPGKR